MTSRYFALFLCSWLGSALSISVEQEPHGVVSQSSSVRLRCLAQNAFSLRWTSPAGTELSRERELQLKNIGSSQEGSYTCTVQRRENNQSASLLLSVRYKPLLAVDRPQVITAFGFGSVHLHCSVHGFATRQEWLDSRGNVLQNPRFHELVQLTEGLTTNMVLVIEDPLEEDLGQYLCKAENEFGSTEAIVTLVGPDAKLVIDLKPGPHVNNATDESDKQPLLLGFSMGLPLLVLISLLAVAIFYYFRTVRQPRHVRLQEDTIQFNTTSHSSRDHEAVVESGEENNQDNGTAFSVRSQFQPEVTMAGGSSVV